MRLMVETLLLYLHLVPAERRFLFGSDKFALRNIRLKTKFESV